MISIIIPVYNVEKYIRKCLDSVILQTYKDFEVVIIDDGSTDKSGLICDEYQKMDSRFRVYHEINGGVSTARNKGLKKARGEWVLFVDSDDWIDERLLEMCMQHVDGKEIDICFFGYQEVKSEDVKFDIDYNRCQIRKIPENEFLNFQYRIFNRDREACCDKNMIKLSSPWKFYKKSLLEENNITFLDNLVNGEDGVFNLYAYQYAKSGICVEEPLYYYRQRQDSVTQKYTSKVERDFYLLHKAYIDFIKYFDIWDKFKEVFQERMIWSFSFCCILKYCHADNLLPYNKKRQQFINEYSQHYEKYVRTVSLKNFSLKKKVIFYFIKKKKFGLIMILCRLQKLMDNIKFNGEKKYEI